MTIPAVAHGQTPARSPVWDVTLLGGYLAGQPDVDDLNVGDNWFHTGEIAGAVAWHWTTHFKTEVDFSTAAESRQYILRYASAPQPLPPIPQQIERFTTVRAASASAIWQFFENEWVHPFVQAGVVVDFDRVRTHTWPQPLFTFDPRFGGGTLTPAEESEGPETKITGGVLVGGGVRAYMSRRVFVRTDGRAVFGTTANRLSFRAGIGVEF